MSRPIVAQFGTRSECTVSSLSRKDRIAHFALEIVVVVSAEGRKEGQQLDWIWHGFLARSQTTPLGCSWIESERGCEPASFKQ